MKKAFRNKLNNKGSSLVLVVVAMGFISILAALMMTVSVAGHQMKLVEAGAKESQYNTETVLNQVCSGLQELSENKMAEAFTYTLTRYASTQELDRIRKTNEKYLDLMEKLVVAQMGSDNVIGYTLSENGTVKTYNFNQNQSRLLVTWLDNLTQTGVQGGVTSDAAIRTGMVVKAGAGANSDEYSITFTQVVVGWQNRGYGTQIVTDIKLAASDMNMGSAGGSADAGTLGAYGIVADGQIVGDGTALLNGNVYGGVGISVHAGEMKIKAEQVLSRGTLEAREGGKISIEGKAGSDSTQLWAKDIRTIRSATERTESFDQISIKGQCNISNDLTMNNPGGSVTLAGDYYGYGLLSGMTFETYGSSMAMNAEYANLDLSKLDNLYLAGRTAISVEQDPMGISPVVSVMQGESISYIWSQNAYLIPGDCLPSVGHNPMTKAEFETMQKLSGHEKFNITRYLPVSLRKYLSPQQPYTEIHVKHEIGTQEQDMVYLYMNFLSPSAASEYFRTYAQSEMEKMDMEAMAQYMGFKGILLNDETLSGGGVCLTDGNILNFEPSSDVTDLGELSVMPGAVGASGRFSELAIDKYYKGNSLVSYLIDTKKMGNPTPTLVSNFVKINALPQTPLKKKVFWAGKGNFVVDAPFEGIILADGNVEINSSVKGLVIATGTVTVKTGSVEAWPGAFVEVAEELEKDNIDLQQYFELDLALTGGESGGGSEGEKPTETLRSGSGVSISFENWRRL